MASITGINTNMGLRLNPAATAWGTAGTFGANEKTICNVTYNDQAPILAQSGLGSGKLFGSGAAKGTATYQLTLDFVGGQSEEATPAGYRNGFDYVCAQFLGASSVSAELTAGQGDYRHTLTYSTGLNGNFCTFSVQETSTLVAEMASVAFDSLAITASAPTSYLSATATGIANAIESASPTNSYASVTALTLADSEVIVVQDDDDFWINAESGGSLSSSDKLNITEYSLSLTKPQSQKNEIKGSSGSGSPTLDAQYTGDLTLTFKELPDHTVINHWLNETYLKCSFNIEGAQIGSGNNRSMKIYIPRMKLLNRPSYSPSTAGTNPYTATFRIFAASANPTGMSSTLPYIELVNTKNNNYIQ